MFDRTDGGFSHWTTIDLRAKTTSALRISFGKLSAGVVKYSAFNLHCLDGQYVPSHKRFNNNDSAN